MTYRIFGDTIVARIDRGEEIVQSLKAICEKENVGHAVVGLYRVGEKKYYSNTLDGEMEMTALTGNVTEKDGEVYLHLHANFADAQGHVFGGHLNEAVVSATCEMFIHTVKGSVGRRPDEVTGLNLFDM